VQKTFSGDGSNLPEVVTWDGMSDAGHVAREGTYGTDIRAAGFDVFTTGDYPNKVPLIIGSNKEET
jgi:hypothetical protein